MIIKSKKTGIVHDVTREQWEAMRERGDNRKYTIIDDSDDKIIPVVIDIEPVEMTEATTTFGVSVEAEHVELSIEYYKDALREAGVDFHHNTGLEKLKQKYEQI